MFKRNTVTQFVPLTSVGERDDPASTPAAPLVMLEASDELLSINVELLSSILDNTDPANQQNEVPLNVASSRLTPRFSLGYSKKETEETAFDVACASPQPGGPPWNEEKRRTCREWYRNRCFPAPLMSQAVFTALVETLTNMRSLEILDFFDLFDPRCTGCISFEDFFLAMLLLLANHTLQSRDFFVLFTDRMFALLSQRLDCPRRNDVVTLEDVKCIGRLYRISERMLVQVVQDHALEQQQFLTVTDFRLVVLALMRNWEAWRAVLPKGWPDTAAKARRPSLLLLPAPPALPKDAKAHKGSNKTKLLQGEHPNDADAGVDGSDNSRARKTWCCTLL